MGEEITVNLKSVVRKKTPETKLSNLFSKYKNAGIPIEIVNNN